MKKRVLSLLVAIAMVLLLIPSSANAATKISKSKISLNEGETVTLKISGTNESIKWTSSDRNVAKVTQKGKVTAVFGGKATIVATVAGEKYTCKVTVKYDEDNMKIDCYNWVVDIWNDSYCDIYHYVEDGKNACGQKEDINKSIKNADSYMDKVYLYDNFIKSLDDDEYSDLKEIWTNVRAESDYLYARIKEETPRPSDESYEFNYHSFNEYMYELQDIIN